MSDSYTKITYVVQVQTSSWSVQEYTRSNTPEQAWELYKKRKDVPFPVPGNGCEQIIKETKIVETVYGQDSIT